MESLITNIQTEYPDADIVMVLVTNQNVTVTIDRVVSATMTENGSEEKIIKVIFDNLYDGKHTVEITYGGSGEFAIGAFLIG